MGYRPSKANNAAMPTHMPSKTGSDYVGQANYAGVAQSVEHLTRNEKVTCSSHATSSKKAVQNTLNGFFGADERT